jgi:hypothetical protein
MDPVRVVVYSTLGTIVLLIPVTLLLFWYLAEWDARVKKEAQRQEMIELHEYAEQFLREQSSKYPA